MTSPRRPAPIPAFGFARPSARAHRPAFTLMELSLAMGMMAMLALTLYMALSIALRARDSAALNVAPVRAARRRCPRRGPTLRRPGERPATGR